MNPRAFCREPGYTSALLLTFDFNPLFFERLCLPELWAGGTGDVLVIADGRQISEASSRWEDQIRHLGHRYQLVRASVRGAFHPKVILRWSPEGGAVWVGSGNLTAGGWGANRELATSWRVGPEATDRGGWIADFAARIGDWLPSRLEHDVLRNLRETPWVAVGAEDLDVSSPLLVSHGGRSLANQLERRWRDRRFDAARILTGSTDRDGALLRWLQTTFGVTRSTVLLEPDRASFDPQRLERLPLEVEVSRHPGKRPIHAKLIWLDGPDGAAAVMGSANCSAAGWLLPPDQGGNVEVVTVYDEASPDEFEALLEIFEAEELETAVLVAKTRDEEDPVEITPERYPVAGIAWERDAGELRISFALPLPAGASVSVELADREMECRATGDRSVWLARRLEPFESHRSCFAAVLVEVGGATTRQHHWINDLTELRHASRGRRIAKAFEDLNRDQAPREQQRMVVELQKIGISLLTDPSAFPDPLARSAEDKEKKQEPEKPARPIDPEELVRSLEDVSGPVTGVLATSGPAGLSLTGVMRALFDFADVHDSEHDAADEPEESPGEEPGKKKRKPRKSTPTKKLRKRLREQMRDYLERFRDRSYPESCTATQMVQAAAYPLAVAAIGSRGDWVDDEEAQSWVVKVFDVLFREQFPGRQRGLLSALRKRYVEHGQEAELRRIVGDGTLWLALLNGLASMTWKGQNGPFEKALALRSVLLAKDLLESSDAGRMRTLVARLEQKKIRASLLAAAPEAARVLDRLEACIRERWSALVEGQEAAELLHQTGDLLWREQVGWATALEERRARSRGRPLEVYLHFRSRKSPVRAAGYYLNVSRAAEQDGEIAVLLQAVQTPDAA